MFASMASTAFAGSRFLRSVHCQFDNGSSIDGDRPTTDNKYSDFEVTASLGFYTESMRAMLSVLANTIEFSQASGTSFGAATSYFTAKKFDPNSDKPQRTEGSFSGPDGNVDGRCSLQFMNGAY